MTPYPGMDMSSLQAMLQSFQPSEDDKRQARAMAAMQVAAGLLGTRRGFEGQGIGQALSGGLLGYQNDLKNVQAQRGQNLQQAMQMRQMMQQMQFAEQGAKLLNGPSTVAQPGPAQGFQIQGGPDAINAAAFAPNVSQQAQDLGGMNSQQPQLAARSLPTSQEVPNQGLYDQLANFNMQGGFMGMPDLSGRIKTKFPLVGQSFRPGGATQLPSGEMKYFPKLGEGMTQDSSGNVGLAPGYLGANDALLAQRAKFEPPIQVPTSSGSTQTVRRDQFAQGGPVSPLATQTAPAANAPAVNQPAPDQPPKLYKGDMPPFNPPAPQVGVSQSTAGKLRDENNAALSKQVLEEVTQRSNAARAGQGFSTMMEDLLNEAGKTGVTSPMLNQAGRIAIAMGVDPDTVNGLLKTNSAPAETLAKITTMAAGQATKQNISSNRPTQFEFGTMLSSTPNPGMQSQAWKAAIRIMHGTENAALAENQAAHDWSDSHQGDMTGFPAWWNQSNPDTSFLPDKGELRTIFSTPAGKSAATTNAGGKFVGLVNGVPHEFPSAAALQTYQRRFPQ